MNQNPTSNAAWEEKLSWLKSSSQFRTLDTIDGEPMEFEWQFSPRIQHIATLQQSPRVLVKMSIEPEDFMSKFNDISRRSKNNEKECESSAHFVSISARRFSPRKWLFLGPGIHKSKPQGEWDTVAEQMMIKCARRGHPVFRSTSPLSRGTLKSKDGGKLSVYCCADGNSVETVFRTIITVNQFSIHGAVSVFCDECKTCHVKTRRPVLARQSDPLFVPRVMKTHTHLDR